MRTVTLPTPAKDHQYNIYIGTGIIGQIDQLCNIKKYSNVFVITDQNVAKHWLSTVVQALPAKSSHVILAPGEQHKHIGSLTTIWQAMHRAGCDRKSLIITLGGGVIGDIGGMAAATYMRGVDCLHVPTTLLAQIDSSIGGKTAIDFDGVKNLVGVFSQPTAVIIDIATLSTLPEREFLSGFGEIIKHGLIGDAGYLQRATSKRPGEFSNAELEKIVGDSCQIKARVVESDETEYGPRKALNFGHTIGHAIESLSLDTDSPLLHGEAISIGMAVESDISARAGLLPSKDAETIKELLLKAGLPTVCPRYTINAVISKLRSDKKNEFGSICFTLLDSIGNAIWNKTVDSAIVVGALEDNMEKNK